MLNEQDKTGEILTLTLHLCNNHVLDKLAQGQQEYPYSELIKIEKQRIYDFYMNISSFI